MQIVIKKGAEDSLCKTSLPKCFKTTNFDTFHQEMSLQHVFQIPLPNSDYAIDNILVVYFVLGSYLPCSCHVLTKENVY